MESLREFIDLDRAAVIRPAEASCADHRGTLHTR